MTQRTTQKQAILEFWQTFQGCAAKLATATSVDDPSYEALLECVQAIDSGLYLEFSTEPDACELIITAEGNQSLFSLVHTIVDGAPLIRGWTVHALKPKLGFPLRATWEGFEIQIAEVVFDPLERSGTKSLGLRLYVPDLQEHDVESAHSALLRAIDHGLGEQQFAEAVEHTEVLPFPPGLAASNFIPLTDLEAFLEWRRGKQLG